jgi:hypothetical protein
MSYLIIACRMSWWWRCLTYIHHVRLTFPGIDQCVFVKTRCCLQDELVAALTDVHPPPFCHTHARYQYFLYQTSVHVVTHHCLQDELVVALPDIHPLLRWCLAPNKSCNQQLRGSHTDLFFQEMPKNAGSDAGSHVSSSRDPHHQYPFPGTDQCVHVSSVLTAG